MRFMFALLALIGGANQAPAAAPAWMPMPVKVEPAAGRFVVDANFTVELGAGASADLRLSSAARRFLARVARQTGIILTPRPAPAGVRRLRIECPGGPAYPTLGEDESYTLDVSPAEILLRAATVEGALHGMETLAQAIEVGPDGFEVAAAHIEDRPRFPWRGLMLDACRHWMPVGVVKRNLDAMAAVKMNVFHWHLSDDQGFRVESLRYPRLHELGSNGDYYTQDQIRDVVDYARNRGIRVIPEFDMPGHTTAWFAGYPELASAPGPYAIGTNYGVFDAAMDPTKEETYAFLDGFIGEMARLFPDPFFHIGGDEVNGRQWNQSAAIQAFAKEHNLADPPAIQVYFNQRLQKILETYGKTMIGWDEILNPGLPTESMIQSWRGQKSLAAAAVGGYRGILSWGYYLDHLRPAAYLYGVDPLSAETAQLTPEQAARILGGEACMWAEMVDSETVDSRIWPRAAAIAERFWSPRELADTDSMYDRMEAVSRWLEWTGIEHRGGYAPMLARLAGNQPAGPVRVLADAVEARGLGQGRSASRATTTTPLNRLVDAARPESESVRALERAARRFIANPKRDAEDLGLLRRAFAEWAANDARLFPLAENNALLAEVKPLSKDLAALGAAGLRMLDCLAGGRAAPAGWLARQNTEMARMQKPAVDALMAAARPVKLLADALARRAKR
jgi:hexosaminidase